MEDTKRIIIVSEDKNKKQIKLETKQKIPRVETKTWKLTCNDLEHNAQLTILDFLLHNTSIDNNSPEHTRFFRTHIRSKISNYKHQDITKKMLSSEHFVSLEEVLKLLHDCRMKCAYCSKNVHVFYNFVRESSQWTLDRIHNDFGHNSGNLIIACLECNIKRRCTSKKAFMFEKNLVIEKIG